MKAKNQPSLTNEQSYTFSSAVVNSSECFKKYIAPRIEWIPIDNVISLALEFSPPIGPSETLNSVQSPFK
jgi:hypothetical protein